MFEFEFPGRIYQRRGSIDYSQENEALVENWIREFERRRQNFVFPEKNIRLAAILILVLGLLTLIVQVKKRRLALHRRMITSYG